ncbi:MAG: ABC transporter substrate-binding protein [Pseudomonadota bacterium]
MSEHGNWRSFLSPTLIGLGVIVSISLFVLTWPATVERLIDQVRPGSRVAAANLDPIRLAYVADMSGTSAEAHKRRLWSAESLIAEINETGGAHGHPIAIDVFDDRNDPEEAKRIAEEIGAGNTHVAVIGHGRSATSMAAAGLYRLYKIPVVAPSSTNPQITRFNEWSFRVPFEDNLQSRILANYAKHVLNADRIAVVYLNDVYTVTIRNTFEEAAKAVGLKIVQSSALSAEPRTPEVKDIAAALHAHGNLDAVLVSLYPEQAEPLITEMNALNSSFHLIGPDALAQVGFATPDGGALSRSAHFTEGMFITVPFIPDAANEKARRFMDGFASEHGKNATWQALHTHDTALVLAEALRRSAPADMKSSTEDLRQALRDRLSEIAHPMAAVQGLTGPIYFDQDGDARRTVYVTRSRNGVLSASLQQFRHDPEAAGGGSGRAERGIVIDDVPMRIADIVYTGVNVEDVRDIDEASGTFGATFDIWFRYRGDLDFSDIEFIDAAEPIVLSTPQQTRDVRGEKYRSFRVDGTFRFAASSQNLITGTENLAIRFRHSSHDLKRLAFAVDASRMEFEGADGLAASLRERDVLGSKEGWDLRSASVHVEEVRKSTLGDPAQVGNSVPFSVVNFGMLAARPEVSVRQIVADFLPVTTSWGYVAIFGILFLSTWLRPFSRGNPLFALLAWLSLGTLFFLLAERMFLLHVAPTLPVHQLEILTPLLRCFWWFVPAIWITGLLPHLLWNPMAVRTGYPVPAIAQTFVSIFIYAISGLVVLSQVFGQSLTSIWAASGVLTIILGFALRSLILDAVTGLMLNIERPFQIGHTISVLHRLTENQSGRVVEMNWRTARLKTTDNTMLVVPNSLIGASALVNYSLPSEPVRKMIPVVLDYAVPVTRALRVLEAGARAAVSSGAILAEPSPKVVIDRPVDHGMRYFIQVHIDYDESSTDAANTATMRHVMIHLDNAGISVAPPREVVSIERESEQRNLDWMAGDDRRKLIALAPLFAGLDGEDVVAIAKDMKLRIVKPDEPVIVQGEAGRSMFGLAEGLLSVYVDVDGSGRQIHVASIEPGNFFGEMSLFSGEPRSATVRAATEALVYEISREDLAPVFERNPAAADIVARTIAARQMQNKKTIQDASEEERVNEINKLAANLVKTMRLVFGGARGSSDTAKSA